MPPPAGTHEARVEHPTGKLWARPRPVLLLIWIYLCCGLEGRTQGRSGSSEWTSWGAWSSCSSTCGQGASVRNRRCMRISREHACGGDSHQYRLCRLPECPSGAMPFRELQCALYNSRPVLGDQAIYQWVPFYGAPNLCDLNCLAEGHTFYYTFGRVLDGTPCSPDSEGLCINGRCLTAGCDGVLGSGTHEDHCGQCGGRNNSCLFVQRVFSEATLPSGQSYGYWNVTLIPIGARHIRVTDRSRNYLALMGNDGRYVFNGDWAIDWPGTFQVAGTQVHYSRTNDRDESLWAAGPTGEDLHLQVLYQEPNPGIEFEFWLPRDAYYTLQSHRSPLRQPQTREVEVGPQEAAPAWTGPGPSSPRFSPHQEQPIETETCQPCPGAKGRTQRLLHYCRSDFVFRARVLARLRVGEETRYDIQVQHTYKNWTPLERREFLWAPGACPCPLLVPRAEYLVAAQRHINYEGTLDRLLLPHAGYARPWTPKEDARIQEVAKHCPQTPPPG
ncbi:ADAMTS-like protein 5 isoform X1 [Dromiciops gliroides]|uniref:ADAMTS-like protein 5 isoform X1 n=2 Tax=Dromiciops gliroides TaxID=33562 RepID=UPI001CC6284A|nr:ADAMTS-like protein 5 isoform X1 [Dromiciops gliroides]